MSYDLALDSISGAECNMQLCNLFDGAATSYRFIPASAKVANPAYREDIRRVPFWKGMLTVSLVL
jgi:hypothetical protein